jgi:NADH-quinone oxidoreductase subunit J
MSAVFFFIAGIGAIAGAIGVVTVRNPFYSVLALVSHLVCLAALFLLLRAEFVAAAQVVVYAGAVMVLYVFVVAYVGGGQANLAGPSGRGMRAGAFAFAGVVFVELAIAILGSGLQAIDSKGAPYHVGFGTPGQIGELLLTKFLFPFEIASFLLLIAAVGGVVLARRRGGIDGGAGDDAISVLEFVRPVTTGTMAEAVDARPALGAGSQEPQADKRKALVNEERGW